MEAQRFSARAWPLLSIFLAGRLEAGPASAAAMRTEAAPVPETDTMRLDGELTESVWRTAPPITEFLQREPNEGAMASFPTEARVAYDDGHFYVAIRAFDPEPDRIVALLTRRDESSPSDWLRVMVDSYRDRKTAYEFAVNAAGVKQDKYRFNDSQEDPGWDAVWDVEVRRDQKGWSAEFRIPFSQLRFDPKKMEAFGFALVRQIGRLNETSSWPLLSRAAHGYVSSFGEIFGISAGRTLRRLEVVPYAVARVTTETAAGDNPLVDTFDPGASAGADLRFALTPGLTLTGTVNPDFGQVEADPAVVNLTAFETFFSERRPFFVEGSGVFRFDVNCNDGQCTGLFYPRRIGRTPQIGADVPEGGYASYPLQTTILGAAKLSGRVGNTSLGALSAVTAEETAALTDGSRRFGQVVEPGATYSLVRVKREFRDQSSLGTMLTATRRGAAESAGKLANEAYTGGLDWDWRVGGRYSITGYWAGSRVEGDPAALAALQRNNVHGFARPDARHLEEDPTRTSLGGHSALFSLSKIAGERVRFNSNAGFKSPGFEINDLGFLRRADEKHLSNWLQIRHDRPSRHLRTFRINFNQWSGWNFGGERLFGGGNINAHAVFTNNWRTGAGVNRNLAVFDDRLTRGGPGGRRNPSWGVWHYVQSDDRRPVSFEYFGYEGWDGLGSRQVEANPRLTLRPGSALMVSLGARWVRNLDDYQWVEKVSGERDHYVFGRLDQTTLAFVFRVNYTLGPNLSVQVYAEPFVSAGGYTGFKELADGGARDYERRFAPFAYSGRPDFNFRSFRTTNVLRWEYRPGSTLFVVWQQGRQDETGAGDFRFGRDFAGAFGAPARNVLLVKLAFWMNY